MTRWSSSTFFLARPKVPSYRGTVSTNVENCVGVGGVGESYSLLGELTGTLVLRVTQQFDDTLLVGGEAVQ